MKGRQLPRTTTIVQQENNALKNKIKCLEESLQSAYTDVQQLREENKKLKNIIEFLFKTNGRGWKDVPEGNKMLGFEN